MPSASSLPTCPDCDDAEELEGNIPDESVYLTFDELEARRDEIEFIESTKSENAFRHMVDVTGIVAMYEELPESWTCSYIGHLHKNGVLVQSRCGKLLAIGMDCGRDNIDGFEHVEREIDVRSRVRAENRFHRDRVDSYVDEIQQLEAACRGRLQGLADLGEHLPELCESMQRANQFNELVVEIEVDRFDIDQGRRVKGTTRHELRGTVLFRPMKVRPWDLDKLIDEANSYRARWDGVQIGRIEAPVSERERNAINRQRDELKAWLRETGRFWEEENLKAAYIRSGSPENARPVGNTIVVKKADEQIVLTSIGKKRQ